MAGTEETTRGRTALATLRRILLFSLALHAGATVAGLAWRLAGGGDLASRIGTVELLVLVVLAVGSGRGLGRLNVHDAAPWFPGAQRGEYGDHTGAQRLTPSVRSSSTAPSARSCRSCWPCPADHLMR